MHWSHFRGFGLKSLGIQIITTVWINSVSIREAVTLSSVTYTSWFMVGPFFITLLLPLPPLTLITLAVNIIFLYLHPSPTQMFIITPFYVMPYVPGTHYLTVMSLPSLNLFVWHTKSYSDMHSM